MVETVRKPTGAKASPRHVLCGSIPHRIVGETPTQFIVTPAQLSDWLNFTQGTCVTAEEAFAKAAYSVMKGQPELFTPDSVVQAWATEHDVLNGAVISDVLDWMVQKGFVINGTLYNDGPKTTIDWTKPNILQNAIAQGPVKIGVASNQLQGVVGTNSGWVATGFSQDPNTDHCVALCGYGPASWLAQQLQSQYGVTVHFPSGFNTNQSCWALYTWKTIGIIDNASMIAITSEAWLRSPTTVGPSPTPIPIPPVPPSPPSPPTPPSPSIRQDFDAVMARLEAMASGRALHELQAIQTLIDNWLVRNGYSEVGADAINWQRWLTLLKGLLQNPIFKGVALAMIQAALTQTGLPPAIVAELQELLQQYLGDKNNTVASISVAGQLSFRGH